MTFRDTSADRTLTNANEGIMRQAEIMEENNRQYILGLEEQLRQANKEIDALKAEVTHWKANHANIVNRSRVLIDRTDLPIERVKAFEQIEQLKAENDALNVALLTEQTKCAGFAPVVARLLEENAALKAENGRLREDAERYRRLRGQVILDYDYMTDFTWLKFPILKRIGNHKNPDCLDDKLDAMKDFSTQPKEE